MSEHTPTPWRMQKAKFATDGEYDWAISANIDGQPRCIAEAFGRVAEAIVTPANANAAFIVRAVNSHDRLVKALGEMSRYLPILERAETDPELWDRITKGLGIATLNGYRAALAEAGK